MSEQAIRIHLGDWSVEIPDGWEHEVEESALLMRHPETNGMLQFSAVSKIEDGDVTEDDLAEFVDEMGLAEARAFPASYGAFEGLHIFSEPDLDTATQHWVLRADTLMLLISYTCNEEENGVDDKAIVETLELLQREETKGEAPILQ